MPFADDKYHRPAVAGDIGVSVFVVKHALAKLSSALERIANAAGVDVSDDVESILSDVRLLDKEFDELTGWRSE